MFLVGSYERMISDLYSREYNKSTDLPITIGILVADCRRQFCRENILNHLDRMDEMSGKLIDFYIPGYCKKDHDDYSGEFYTEVSGITHSFSKKLYYEFLTELRKKGIRITGNAQFILIEYVDGKLNYNNKMVFDLERDERSNVIVSPQIFFDYIFKISEEYVGFEVYSKKIAFERRKLSVVNFVRENLPGYLIGKFT